MTICSVERRPGHRPTAARTASPSCQSRYLAPEIIADVRLPHPPTDGSQEPKNTISNQHAAHMMSSPMLIRPPVPCYRPSRTISIASSTSVRARRTRGSALAAVVRSVPYSQHHPWQQPGLAMPSQPYRRRVAGPALGGVPSLRWRGSCLCSWNR